MTFMKGPIRAFSPVAASAGYAFGGKKWLRNPHDNEWEVFETKGHNMPKPTGKGEH
jgi:hypothetical protein